MFLIPVIDRVSLSIVDAGVIFESLGKESFAAALIRISSHYKEPTELEIQEMVNILVSGEEYDIVFNHLDMLHAPLEGKDLCVSCYPNQVSPLESNLGKLMSLPQSLEKLPEDSLMEVKEFGVLIMTLWKTEDHWVPQ
ncbi:hypothetical protein Tco_0427464 [Tanacetum coccineum]